MVDQHMTGKICLVTGATDGIGLVTARALAEMGATVIVHGRDPQKTDRTVQAIRQAVDHDRVDAALADFADQTQIRALADHVKTTYDRLDVLVNNAGVFMMRRAETADGFETMFAINHLGPFLLTNLLLDLIRASAPARIVNVSSSAHLRGQLDFDDLQLTQGFRGMPAYGNSKLMNVLFTYELARRLADTGIAVNALHPGVVGTNLAMNNLGPFAPLARWIFHRLTISAEEGAQTSIFLASSPPIEGVTSRYFYQSKEQASSSASHDEDAQRRLWEISQQLTGLG